MLAFCNPLETNKVRKERTSERRGIVDIFLNVLIIPVMILLVVSLPNQIAKIRNERLAICAAGGIASVAILVVLGLTGEDGGLSSWTLTRVFVVVSGLMIVHDTTHRWTKRWMTSTHKSSESTARGTGKSNEKVTVIYESHPRGN